MTTTDYLTQLQQDREDLIDNLTTQGIENLTGDETFTELVPKVLDISTGGTSLYPLNVSNIVTKTADQQVTVSWTDPQDTYDATGQHMVAWAGTKLVRKLGGIPANENDGVTVLTSTTRNQYSSVGYTDTGLTNGDEYGYGIFPFSDSGAYNTNSANTVTVIPSAIHIYGVKRLLTDTSATGWVRTDDAVGLVANATHDGTTVRNDFDNLYPWSDFISYNYDVTNQIITAYYGDNNFAFDGTNGLVLTRVPKFWYKKWQDGTWEYRQIADREVEGFIEINSESPGRFPISNSASSPKSQSGSTPVGGSTRAAYRTGARGLGSDFGIIDHYYFAIRELYLIEYANSNSQETLGVGVTNASAKVASGGCNSLGMKSGCLNNDGNHSVIYRGIEDIFGNIYQWIDGLNISNYYTYVCYDHTKYADDVFSGDYSRLSYQNSTSNNYISKLGCDSNNPLIAMPTEVNGSSTTGYCDYYYCNSGNKIVCVGGYCSVGAWAGLWYCGCGYGSSNTYDYIGSRLLKY